MHSVFLKDVAELGGRVVRAGDSQPNQDGGHTVAHVPQLDHHHERPYVSYIDDTDDELGALAVQKAECHGQHCGENVVDRCARDIQPAMSMRVHN